jgi:hypothetical protein
MWTTRSTRKTAPGQPLVPNSQSRAAIVSLFLLSFRSRAAEFPVRNADDVLVGSVARNALC